jgi:hypothetical protein
VNQDLVEDIRVIADKTKPEETLGKLKAIELARNRIASNVRENMVLESLGVSLRLKRN